MRHTYFFSFIFYVIEYYFLFVCFAAVDGSYTLMYINFMIGTYGKTRIRKHTYICMYVCAQQAEIDFKQTLK